MTKMPSVDDRSDWVVPTYERFVFGNRSHKYALVIPVINEGDRIRGQLQRISNIGLPVDVVIVDGGSTDGSLEHGFLQSVGVRALLVKTGPGKLSAQLRCAYSWCLNERYDGIVTIDGNGKDNVEAVETIAAKLEMGYGYVQGSRYRKGGKAENTPLERTIGNRGIHAPLMSLAGRRFYTDTTNGYRGYSAAYLLDPRVKPFRDVFMRYELLFYLTIRAGQLGCKTCEVPVERSYPKTGAIPTKISGHGAKFDVLKQAIGAAFGCYHP